MGWSVVILALSLIALLLGRERRRLLSGGDYLGDQVCQPCLDLVSLLLVSCGDGDISRGCKNYCKCHAGKRKGKKPGCAEMSMKKNPFHITCAGCHKKLKKGPTKCKACHKK